MTRPDTAAIEARLAAATPGPEQWAPIPGTEGYEVSDRGNVRSWWTRRSNQKVRADEPRTLKPRPGRPDGSYPSVSLPRAQGGYVTRQIHSLVLLAFVGPRPQRREIAHLNGDAKDNRLVNLAYVTHAENEAHKREHGTWDTRKGGAILSTEFVAEIKYLLNLGISQAEVSRAVHLDKRHVNDIAREKTWADVAPTDLRALLDEAERLRATLAAVAALAEEWSTATCQTDGAPCSWHRVSAECAAELRDALDGDR